MHFLIIFQIFNILIHFLLSIVAIIIDTFEVADFTKIYIKNPGTKRNV